MNSFLDRYAQLAPWGLAYQAEKEVRKSIALCPTDIDAWAALTAALYSQGRFAEAVEAGKLYQALGGSNPEWALIMGKSYAELGEFQLADSFFLTAEQSLNSNSVRWECGLHHLLIGRAQQGWAGYQSRLQVYSRSYLHIYPFDLAPWDGAFKKGATLLLHGEQGLGDEVMFARWIPEVLAQAKDQGMKVYVAVTPPLLALFQNSFPEAICLPHSRGDADVFAWEAGFKPAWLSELPANTQHCPTGSLPFWLANKKIAPLPYLKPVKKDVDFFKKQLAKHKTASGKKRKVGLAWCANLRTAFGRSKSIDLPLFAQLSQRPDLHLIGIQGPEHGHLAQQCPDVRMIDLHQELDGLDRVAGLMANLDSVITIDTSYAHLAGALGVPTHLLLKKSHDWRFSLDTAQHFYASLQHHVQKTSGDWAGLLNEVAAEI